MKRRKGRGGAPFFSSRPTVFFSEILAVHEGCCAVDRKRPLATGSNFSAIGFVLIVCNVVFSMRHVVAVGFDTSSSLFSLLFFRRRGFCSAIMRNIFS